MPQRQRRQAVQISRAHGPQSGSEPAWRRRHRAPAPPCNACDAACCLQVQHAAALEQLHAQHQAWAAAGHSALAQPVAAPRTDAEGDTAMADAPASTSGSIPGSFSSVRELVAARLRDGSDAAEQALLSQLREAEAAPGVPLGDERLGRGSDAPPPSLPGVERLLIALTPEQLPVAGEAQLAGWQQAWADAREAAAAREQLASAVTAQWLDAQGAIACLLGDAGRYLMRRQTMFVGRATQQPSEVDLDLSSYPGSSHVSRLSAALRLGSDGAFTLTNMGRRELAVDGKTVSRAAGRSEGRRRALPPFAGCACAFVGAAASCRRPQHTPGRARPAPTPPGALARPGCEVACSQSVGATTPPCACCCSGRAPCLRPCQQRPRHACPPPAAAPWRHRAPAAPQPAGAVLHQVAVHGELRSRQAHAAAEQEHSSVMRAVLASFLAWLAARRQTGGRVGRVP